MSHITKGTIAVKINDEDLLIKALLGLGTVTRNDQLYRVGYGLTSETYDLVLTSEKNNQYRIGYKKNRDGSWSQYQEDYGNLGQWTKQISEKIQDRYIAYHYERELKSEGFNVSIKTTNDGAVELEFEEQTW